MKASLKFRDEQKPLVRAKIPLTILGLPFLSAISAGDTSEVRLELATAFKSGPALRFSYRPNDSWNPFSLVVKTGTGALGSPFAAPMSMSAEFSLLDRGGPSIFIHFKPQIGDFCVKKIAGSATSGVNIAAGSCGADGESSVGEVVTGRKANGFPKTGMSYPGKAIDMLLSGIEVTARSLLPIQSQANVKFRWGFRIPAEIGTAFSDEGGGGRKHWMNMPILVMSKISVEQVEKKASDDSVPTEASSSVHKRLDNLQAENGELRKAVEELRAEFSSRKVGGGIVGTGSQPAAKGMGSVDARDGNWRAKGGVDGRVNGARGVAVSPATAGESGRNGRRIDGKGIASNTTKDDVNEQLKRALMEATSGSSP